jgi:hypothetical protein
MRNDNTNNVSILLLLLLSFTLCLLPACLADEVEIVSDSVKCVGARRDLRSAGRFFSWIEG